MSSTDSPTKSWWPRSKASAKELRKSDIRPARPPSGLKSIAVAIGLRPKKPSKEPLSPAVSSQLSDPTTGPKSPSSTLSPIDPYSPSDTRPRTPRQSLLTIADDPFAGHPPVVFVNQSPVPSRLSVYSSPSVTDLVSRKTDSPVYRSSYASSSTNSNSLGLEVNANSMSNSHHALPESKKLRLKRSIGSMQVKLADDLSRQNSYLSSTSRSGEEPLPVGDEAPVRPKMRSRGMTVGGPPPKSSFFVKEQMTRKLSQSSKTSNIPTLVKVPDPLSKLPFVFRQTSSRLVSPPTAPPTLSLPAPPPIPEQPDFRQRKGLNSPPYSSTSSLSLVNDQTTSLSPIRDDCDSSQQTLPTDDSFSRSVESSSKTAPRTLRKPPSQRSLRRTASPSSSMSNKTTTPDASEKRKQRNSQQSRLPMPTLSLSIRTSLVSTSSQPRNGVPASPSSITEQRKSRRRLFSGGQRPSTSTCVTSPREDDLSSLSSVSSLPSDHDTICTPYKPWTVTRNYPKSSSSSFWDESLDTIPTSPAASNIDYHPQAIMSRDELAKLEASISKDKPEQKTCTDSTLSSPLSNGPEALQDPRRIGLSPPPSMRSSIRSSDSTFASSTLRSGSSRRPFTADPLMRDNSKGVEIGAAERHRAVANLAAAQLDTIPDSTSLPPPPRRRILSSNSVWSTVSTSTTSTLIQSPVERLNSSKAKLLERPNTAITTTSPLQPGALGTSSLPTPTLPVPPRPHPTSRGKIRSSGLEKAIHRRSIMRKPSFLEIDVETDPESETEVAEKRDSLFLDMKSPSANGKTGESFLDFARESFDTVQS